MQETSNAAELFRQRYNNLNQQQREAVDTIYGPVMVIAGPGTGKTEVLSVRIANLLNSEAQVQPQEILCLTYTDEATNSMRRRLLQIIDTAAHKVNISTFHGFCNNVIQSNPEYFSHRTLQPVTDLERTELLYKMLDELPQGHTLRKLSGNIYYDAGRLNRLFDLMKRENLRPQHISDAVDSYLAALLEDPEYRYKRNGKDFKKGDLKQSQIDAETKTMNTTRAAAHLFDEYERRMKEAGRYDFNDMIIWVLDAFKNNPALLLSYQERHQFILVDEFQDTNGSQNDLLTLLTEFWEDPNVFVVGDDDQSIYEFQGARIRNIIDFYNKYKESIKVVVLPQNYRSSQAILDKALATINQNKQRLIEELKELQLDKNIVASHPRFADGKDTVTPVIKVYPNLLNEEADIVLQIEALKQQGVPLKEIAVIYAQHKQADNIIALMERKGIPFYVKRPVNILELPLIQQIVNIISYLDEERTKPFSAEAILFEIMHMPSFGIEPTDVAQMSIYMNANRIKDKALGYWRTVLNNTLLLESENLRSAKEMSRLGSNIDAWLRVQQEIPLPLLLEKIVYESGIVKHLLNDKEYIWKIQVLNTFFEFVRDVHSRNPRTRPAELLKMLEQMEQEGISIPVQKVITNENGVHFYTAHGAKGNEFEHVFLIGATKNFWENKRGGGFEYKLPETLTSPNNEKAENNKEEVARRLFYVALTRAKKHLHVSYSAADNNGKSLEASQFIDEICPDSERVRYTVPASDVVSHIQWAITPVPKVRILLANNQYIDKVLQQFTLSYTTLSKYLRCPLSFYYEHILRVPFLKSDALAFGSAVHDALERFFKEMKQSGTFPERDTLLTYFRNALFGQSASFTPVQWERRTEQGNTMLSEYYDHYIHSFSKNVEIEFQVPRMQIDGVWVTGKIDKIELEGDSCTVVDYKTGDPDKSAAANTSAPSEKAPLGGDYWRQMVFYKLLIDNYSERNWTVSMGMFEYLEKSKKSNEYRRIYVPMYQSDLDTVKAQLKDTWARIQNHEFDRGCGEPDCHWCNFAKQYEILRPVEEVEIDDV
ncbi:MAG: ATP-dependent helicase [Flavipsychrobacter sp.]|nr:ATP-dependent helicase [Flavipsychrobacter sp.]